MTLNRYARRRDANEAEIVAALRTAGALVYHTDTPADLLVDYHGHWYVLEVKDGSKPPSARTLTPAVQRFADNCRHSGAHYAMVLTIEGALHAIGAIH